MDSTVYTVSTAVSLRVALSAWPVASGQAISPRALNWSPVQHGPGHTLRPGTPSEQMRGGVHSVLLMGPFQLEPWTQAWEGATLARAEHSLGT